LLRSYNYYAKKQNTLETAAQSAHVCTHAPHHWRRTNGK